MREARKGLYWLSPFSMQRNLGTNRKEAKGEIKGNSHGNSTYIDLSHQRRRHAADTGGSHYYGCVCVFVCVCVKSY